MLHLVWAGLSPVDSGGEVNRFTNIKNQSKLLHFGVARQSRAEPGLNDWPLLPICMFHHPTSTYNSNFQIKSNESLHFLGPTGVVIGPAWNIKCQTSSIREVEAINNKSLALVQWVKHKNATNYNLIKCQLCRILVVKCWHWSASYITPRCQLHHSIEKIIAGGAVSWD